MKKQINEKTFELNITNELLNLSKAFVWYMENSPIKDLISNNIWPEFSNQTCLYGIGLTQEEESNINTGGYDVSINYALPGGYEARLMCLQYKAGIHSTYSKLSGSQFERKKGVETDHVCFTFNDAAKKTQHSTLRKLAISLGKTSDSVMYVLPRITKKEDFLTNIGRLIYKTSFVPVLEIDAQGERQNPKIEIKDGVKHKFRTSYDGTKSEVNLLLLLLVLDHGLIGNLLSELICIQIERLLKIFKRGNRTDLTELLDNISVAIDQYFESQLKGQMSSSIKEYIENVRDRIIQDYYIPSAPSNFTTIIPEGGIRLNFEEKLNLSNINYQIF